MLFAATALELLPLIVTLVPTTPEIGEKDEIVGWANALPTNAISANGNSPRWQIANMPCRLKRTRVNFFTGVKNPAKVREYLLSWLVGQFCRKLRLRPEELKVPPNGLLGKYPLCRHLM